MKKFRFQFESLMKVRISERDLRRQMLADLLRRDAELVQAREQVEHERTSQLNELKQLVGPGSVNIDRSAARRFYAGQLIGDLGGIEQERAVLAVELSRCRELLIKADQGVKALEKLEETARARFLFDEERRAARELEEGWQALHCGDQRTC